MRKESKITSTILYKLREVHMMNMSEEEKDVLATQIYLGISPQIPKQFSLSEFSKSWDRANLQLLARIVEIKNKQ